MSTANPSQRIAEWVAQAQFTDIPRRVIEEAKNQVLSVIAAVHAGHFSDAGRTVSRTVKEWSGGKDATMIPSGERTSLGHAIFANAALGAALDYDDYLLGASTGHSAVLVTLALAEKIGFTGKDFLLAQVLANEIEGRVGLSVYDSPLRAYATPYAHPVGSAIVTAKLLGLDAAQTHTAVALALAQPPRPLAASIFGSDAKGLMASMAAPTGVQAAQLAANGLRAGVEIIEGDQGFASVLAAHPLLGAFEGFGKVWLTDTLCYKVYPGSVYIDSTVDCVLALVRQHSLDAKKVRAVQVAANAATFEMGPVVAPYLKGPDSLPATLNFHLPYNVAVALVDRELTARQFSRERIRDKAVWDMASRVTVTQDEVMTQRMRERTVVKTVRDENGERPALDLATVDLSNFKMSCGARIRIETEDGRSLEAEQEVPFGAAGRPYDERRKSVEDKFRRETRYTLRKEKMEKAIDLILHLDQGGAAQLRELVRLCCSERS